MALTGDTIADLNVDHNITICAMGGTQSDSEIASSSPNFSIAVMYTALYAAHADLKSRSLVAPSISQLRVQPT